MSSTNSIHVGLLHKQDVLQHTFFAHHLAGKRIVFVTVYSAKTYGFPVNKNLSLLNFHTTESDFRLYLFYRLPSFII
ncbi:MAG: hypothetical protein BWX77_00798 [Bacteroidetes bacterium ADurb.Bin090]|nr:MAG: hypothetical protein BWX77_00798 [Bacteroidetes bacterium ADurb.Bin090]